MFKMASADRAWQIQHVVKTLAEKIENPICAGKKETIHSPAPVQNLSFQKKDGDGVHGGNTSVVDMVFWFL